MAVVKRPTPELAAMAPAHEALGALLESTRVLSAAGQGVDEANAVLLAEEVAVREKSQVGIGESAVHPLKSKQSQAVSREGWVLWVGIG